MGRRRRRAEMGWGRRRRGVCRGAEKCLKRGQMMMMRGQTMRGQMMMRGQLINGLMRHVEFENCLR